MEDALGTRYGCCTYGSRLFASALHAARNFVKRYTLSDGDWRLTESPTGEFVDSTDAAAVERERDALRATAETLRREIRNMQEAAKRRNRDLAALKIVWCDGGCANGVEGEVTEEIVQAAERNTARLRRWWTNHQARAAERELPGRGK